MASSPVDNELAYRTAGELASELAQKRVSAVELVDAAIARIDALDGKINAVVVRDFDRARAAAQAADLALARGEGQPLLGLPITVKEQYNVAGLPTTWGDPQFRDWHPEDDALVVARLKGAGAIVLGKTNVPPALMDWQSGNTIYGTTNNPWNLALTPGGSSGGAAAALASGFVALELGSDIGGSLRCPAHFCGVYAHKPSLDLVPSRGAGPPGTPAVPVRGDLAVLGPMARCAGDLALALDVLAGPDPWSEGIGYRLALPPPRHSPSLPDLVQTTKNYVELLTAFNAVSLPADEREHLLAATRALATDGDSISAARVRGLTMSHTDWVMASRLRIGLRQRWQLLFRDFDIVLCPPMPTAAFPHDHSARWERYLDIDGATVPYGDQIAWASIAILTGFPATAAPIDRSADGLPIGVQIIGGYLEDRTTIAFAGLVEREFGGFTPPPHL
jgi:amidase